MFRYAAAMDDIAANTWVAACAHHLQKHWRTVDPTQLEEVARELLDNTQLQPLEPADAAALWLQPVASTRTTAAGPLSQQVPQARS